MTTLQRSVFLTLLLFSILSAAAGQPKRNWTKVQVSRIGRRAIDVPRGVLRGFGADLVSDYGSFAILYVPKASLSGLTRALQAEGLSVRERDELDVLRLPGATVDVRNGLENAPPDGVIKSYPAGRPGLFTVQFAAPPRREWLTQLKTMGWMISRYLHSDGYLAIGTADLMARTRALDFVQWVDFYHPYQKYRSVPEDSGSRSMIFDVPTGVDLTNVVNTIRGSADEDVRVIPGSVSTWIVATISENQVDKILRHELVVGVQQEPLGQLSDERQAMALTSQLNGSQTQPLVPRGASYWNWVVSKCSACSTMPSSTWKVGFVDYGLDDGQNVIGAGHPDLEGRKYYGLRPAPSPCTPTYPSGCDTHSHGTMTASVAAGSPSVGSPVDADGYSLGGGVAPLAGMFMTSFRLQAYSDLPSWTADAVANAVTIQNHSINDYTYPDHSGQYDMIAEKYDELVRDADPSSPSLQQPLFITVATGNNNQGPQANGFPQYCNPGSTAKNVVAIGAVESVREISCSGCASDSYNNVSATSRVGTLVPGYYKPDLMAPGTAVVAAKSTATVPPTSCGVEGANAQYLSGSGTSFAAPVAAGAAIIVKRYLAATPQATSPALTKAMLIAGARSIKGGEDRAHNPVTSVGAVPNMQQGFGRLSFEDILTSTLPLVYDQEDTRLMRATGDQYVARFRVHDAAKPVKVVLAWTDAPGNPISHTGTPTLTYDDTPLTNDLDLQVFPSDAPSTVYLGNKLDSATEYSTAYSTGGVLAPDNTNNVEMARFDIAPNVAFDIFVNAASIGASTDTNASDAEQDFAVVVVNADEVWSFAPFAVVPPANVVADSAAGTATVHWTPVSNVDGYVLERKVDGGQWALAATISNSAQSSQTDTPSFAASGVVLYRLRSYYGAIVSAPSNNDVAYVGTFTDDVLTTSTVVQAVHITELRSAINGLRAIAGRQPFFTPAELDPANLVGAVVDDAEFDELLIDLNAARQDSNVAMPGISFSTTAPDAGVGIARGPVIDLRAGLQ